MRLLLVTTVRGECRPQFSGRAQSTGDWLARGSELKVGYASGELDVSTESQRRGLAKLGLSNLGKPTFFQRVSPSVDLRFVRTLASAHFFDHAVHWDASDAVA